MSRLMYVNRDIAFILLLMFTLIFAYQEHQRNHIHHSSGASNTSQLSVQ